ncbi:MAG: response regulator [Rhodospirillales bacterium]|nr:response regulator [Rhodospirillales bacterium]
MTSMKEQIFASRILVVDDNAANVELLEMMLNLAGYDNVQVTTDSRQVKPMFLEEPFDLILLDIRMPYLDGFQVMEQLAEIVENDYVPILVLTAQKDMETRLRALELGARDFVTKPFDRTEVLNRIENMLEVRCLYNERTNSAKILEHKVMERTQELHHTRLEIIRRLGRAGEYRDNETGMHIIRMSKSSQRLALAAGLAEAHAEMVLNASPMHDVGKIGIPDRILLKPGKLDKDEWEIMKTHPQIGADIIGNDGANLMKMASAIALTHHEKWDGTGYPNGLKGEEIPIEGRISSICDVFDALTSERPYKKAWPVEKAIGLIKEETGKQFDPKLVPLFLEILPDVMEISQEYTDDAESFLHTLEKGKVSGTDN